MKSRIAWMVVLLLVSAGCWYFLKSPSESATSPDTARAPRFSKSSRSDPDAASGTRRVPREESRPRTESERSLDQVQVAGSYEANLAGEVKASWDPTHLKRALEDTNHDPTTLSSLILRAAAEKDTRFRHMLERKDLRESSRVNLAMLAYDYEANGNPAALDEILTSLDDTMKNGGSTDSDELMVLAYVNEWEKSRDTIVSQKLSGDGTGGDALYSFWLKRRTLYPHNPAFPKDFTEFREQLRGEGRISSPGPTTRD